MRIFSLCIILLLFFSSLTTFASDKCQIDSNTIMNALSLPAFSKSGNIYYTAKNDNSIQVTHSGKDSFPVLSPNKKIIAFVRMGNQVIPESCDIDAKYGNEIWIYDLTTKKENRLVKNNFECDKPKKQIVDPENLQFSPDGRTLYFETSAWTTSGAIHVVDVNGKHLRFVTDGGGLRIVQSGPYKGDLIVNQHRYRFKGDTPRGSYDWDWLFTPTGKQIKLYKKEE